MNIVLWILQVLLAVFFLWHGWLYVAPPAEMAGMMNFVAPWFRIFIGAAELLAAAGLVLPGVTRIRPALTVLAAAGLMIVTGSAAVFHLFRGETGSAVMTAVLFVLITWVAYMRWQVEPISSSKKQSRPLRESGALH